MHYLRHNFFALMASNADSPITRIIRAAQSRKNAKRPPFRLKIAQQGCCSTLKKGYLRISRGYYTLETETDFLTFKYSKGADKNVIR